jgi:hypothetical protein
MAKKYTSKLAQEVGKFQEEVQKGYMLAIDPSSGSQGSLPGFAVFKAGRLVDAGTISLPRGTRHIGSRLFLLRDTLEKEFEKPDILAVEWIAPVFPGAKNAYFQKSASSLMKSVGAIMSVWDSPVVEPAPTTWHTMTPPNYEKNDTNDACMIGNAVLITLARILGEPEPAVQLPTTPGVEVVK